MIVSTLLAICADCARPTTRQLDAMCINSALYAGRPKRSARAEADAALRHVPTASIKSWRARHKLKLSRSRVPDWSNECTFNCGMSYEISIRLSEDESGFVYTVRRGGEVIESAVVRPTGLPRFETPLEDYYGGTMAMD